MSEPTQEFLRRSEVVEWLAQESIGIRPWQTRKLMEQNVIKGAPLPGYTNGKDYFRKTQVKQALGL